MIYLSYGMDDHVQIFLRIVVVQSYKLDILWLIVISIPTMIIVRIKEPRDVDDERLVNGIVNGVLVIALMCFFLNGDIDKLLLNLIHPKLTNLEKFLLL